MIIRDNGESAAPPDPTLPNPGVGYDAGLTDHRGAVDAEPRERQPKGDHNRRLALGLDVEAFAAAAGVTVDDLREYEQTWPDHDFDLEIARRVGAALQRLESNPPPGQKVVNGPTG